MLKRILGALRRSDRHDASPVESAPTVRAEQALRAGRVDEAVGVVRTAVMHGALQPEDCIALSQALLAMGSFDAALRAATAEPDWLLSPATHLKFTAVSAVARARRDARAGRRPTTWRLRPGNQPRVSVVICSIDPPSFERAAGCYRRLLADVPHEIIGVHDARSLCEGNNKGARRATGDILLFSHDDVEILGDDFAARLLATMDVADLVGIAGTSRLSRARWISHGHPYIHGQHGIPAEGRIDVQVYSAGPALVGGIEALDGVLLCARRELWERHPFDEDTFRDWHLYDIDFSHTAQRSGYRVAVRCDLPLIHYRRPGTASDDYLGRWEAESVKFLAKHPELSHLPVDMTPDQLCAVAIHHETEWRLLLDELYAPAGHPADATPT
jgi:hypothetical protein